MPKEEYPSVLIKFCNNLIILSDLSKFLRQPKKLSAQHI